MLVRGIGHFKTIADNQWDKYKRMGYKQVVEPKVAVKPQESLPVEKPIVVEALVEVTKEQVCKSLDAKGIKYDKRSKKADLMKLLEV